MTLASTPVPAASALAHRVLAEAHDKAAQVLRRRDPAAAARHAEQARSFRRRPTALGRRRPAGLTTERRLP
jgi:hypothetical protein